MRLTFEVLHIYGELLKKERKKVQRHILSDQEYLQGDFEP